MNSIYPRLIGLAGLAALLGAAAGCQSTNPLEAVRLNRQAQVYFEHGDYDQAMQLLASSLDADYENCASHYWLGRCHEIKNDPDKAVYEYRLAVRFDPALDVAQRSLIQILHRTGQIDPSVQAARVYLRNKTTLASEFIRMAEEFSAEGMDPQAVLAYQRAQQVEPRNPIPSIALADYYRAKGSKDREIDSLTNALMIDPLYPGLARRLGELGQRIDLPEPEGFKKTPPIQRDLTEM
ncbi:MAG: tetratricopeptide repeat protein [Sedimentisphaerales bacterium]|nr:tetratricopeptide repeat protein [Sedimentisphaerales bacterium]